MEPLSEQNFANHARRLPPRYVAGATAAVLALVAGLWELVARPSPGSAALVLVALAAGAGIYYARINALVVQTRLVCLEERLRLARLLPAPLVARIGELGTDQLVATRFASDGEVADLVRQVLEEKLTSRKEIKRRVRTWRADWMRV
jgi:hypothetical protein